MEKDKLKRLFLLLIFCLSIFNLGNALPYDEQVQLDFYSIMNLDNCQMLREKYYESKSYSKLWAASRMEECGGSGKLKIFKQNDYDMIGGNTNHIVIDDSVTGKIIEKLNIKTYEGERENKTILRKLSKINADPLKPIEIDIFEDRYDCQINYEDAREKYFDIEFDCNQINITNNFDISTKLISNIYNYKAKKKSNIELDDNSTVLLHPQISQYRENLTYEVNGRTVTYEQLNSHNIKTLEFEDLIVRVVREKQIPIFLKESIILQNMSNPFNSFTNSFIRSNFAYRSSSNDKWYFITNQNRSILINQMPVNLIDFNNAFLNSRTVVTFSNEQLNVLFQEFDVYYQPCNSKSIKFFKERDLFCIE